MTTVLDKELKRLITVDDVEYTVIVDPDGVRLVGRGKRKPEAELKWRELLSGEAALAVALNASLLAAKTPAVKTTATASKPPSRSAKPSAPARKAPPPAAKRAAKSRSR